MSGRPSSRSQFGFRPGISGLTRRALPPAAIVGAFVLVALSSCANPFRDTYRSTLERWPSGEADRLLPAEETPRIVTSSDVRGDAIRMMERGYLLLGRAKFRGAQVDPKLAREQAKEVGASVVMVEEKYATSVTETVPVQEWIPEREETSTERIYIQSGPNAGQYIEREVTRTIEGEFRTHYVPQQTDYYDYAATFWGKSRPPIFGVLVQALDAEARQRVGANRGVQVTAVISDSPAFHADVLRGDVISSFAGTAISDPEQFFDSVVAHAGEKVEVEMVRGTEPRKIEVQLQAE